jgi:hypothetical protein
MRESHNFSKGIFFWKFLDWVELGPTILVWVCAALPSEHWRTLHCSRRIVEDAAGEEEEGS